MRVVITSSVVALALIASAPAEAGNGGKKHHAWDRIEDRIDRRESRLDRQVTHGPRDRFEDRVDRWEDRRDRLNKPTPRFVKRAERRSWKKRGGKN